MFQTKNKSINIIEHKGKKIYYLNHACLTGDDLLEDIEECERALYGLNNILVLENFQDTQIIDSFDRFYDEVTQKYRAQWKTAILGEKTLIPAFSDIQKLSVIIDAEAFTNREDALNYLAGA